MQGQLTNIQQSKELKELGVPQISYWYWVKMRHNSFDRDEYYLAYKAKANEILYIVFGEKSHIPFHVTCGVEEMSEIISAYTSQQLRGIMANIVDGYYIQQDYEVIELIDAFNNNIPIANFDVSESEIEGRFDMLKFLLEKELLLL